MNFVPYFWATLYFVSIVQILYVQMAANLINFYKVLKREIAVVSINLIEFQSILIKLFLFVRRCVRNNVINWAKRKKLVLNNYEQSKIWAWKG